jgi:uncharacterized repeat protein (TIGR03803 family)
MPQVDLPVRTRRFTVSPLINILPIVLIWVALAHAQTESVIYNFNANNGDGSQPFTSLVSDAAGNLYGTTSVGGAFQAGTVFKLTHGTSGWTETLLYSFSGGKDGHQPGGLVFDGAGNLYGTTTQGGTHNVGVVFRLSPTASGTWKQYVLYNFSPSQGGVPPFGWYPFSLTIDSAGNLYGITLYGIKHPQGGTVFRLSPNPSGGWTHSILYEFSGGVDGEFPALRNLTLDAQGNLYGTTNNGGTYGAGVVFRLSPTPSGPWTETILYAFTGGIDGAGPNGGLIFDKAGNLYGTTISGGSTKCYPGCGVVFKLSPTASGKWVEHQLYVFQNGEEPLGGLISDSSGNLYGTDSQGAIRYSGRCTSCRQQPRVLGPGLSCTLLLASLTANFLTVPCSATQVATSTGLPS